MRLKSLRQECPTRTRCAISSRLTRTADTGKNNPSIGNTDRQGRRQADLIVAAFLLLLSVTLVGVLLLLPSAGNVIAAQFTPGVGLNRAAVIAFFITVLRFIVFAIVAGDGLQGEVQFMLAGLPGCPLVCRLMVAWIF